MAIYNNYYSSHFRKGKNTTVQKNSRTTARAHISRLQVQYSPRDPPTHPPKEHKIHMRRGIDTQQFYPFVYEHIYIRTKDLYLIIHKCTTENLFM